MGKGGQRGRREDKEIGRQGDKREGENYGECEEMFLEKNLMKIGLKRCGPVFMGVL